MLMCDYKRGPQIHTQLISKMDEFLGLADYDWLLPEPRGTSSPWLSDLLAFLTSVFASFTNLPVLLAQRTCMSALQHLARSMQAMLLESPGGGGGAEERPGALTMGLVQQMDLDVVQCEQFAASEPVQGLEVSEVYPLEEYVCAAVIHT